MKPPNDWQLGIQCPKCGHAQLAFISLARRPVICLNCGTLHPIWIEVAIRWVWVKNKGWFTGGRGHYEQKAQA